MEGDSVRILLVEDEEALRVAVADSLRDEGYRVLTAAEGDTGLQLALEEKPDIVVLDVMLPKRDGYSICQELRRLNLSVPVLMLTARGLVDDRVRGLDAGADDYMVKPFSLAELHARLRAIARRLQSAANKPERIAFGDGVQVEFAQRICSRNGAHVDLTAKEFGVLELLVSRAGEPVSRDEFLDVVWGYTAFPTTRTVDNHIARLRQKLERDPAGPEHIVTVPKAGYRFVIEE
ncbi:MAG: response regulator transcription factor [Verrucomicrobiae bacterium]|nr:response regulator transcription factor [Verrucomicrobiae bacterium]